MRAVLFVLLMHFFQSLSAQATQIPSNDPAAVHRSVSNADSRNTKAANSTSGRTIAILENSDIIFAGQRVYPDREEALIIRLSKDGKLVDSKQFAFAKRNSFSHLIAAPGGKIIASGFWNNVSPLLLRLNADLTLDQTFNNTGVVLDDSPYGDWRNSLRTEHGTYVMRTSGSSAEKVQLRRYSDGGRIDADHFGIGGLVEFNTNHFWFWPRMSVDTDGLIYIYGGGRAAQQAVRLLPNGSLDLSFGTSGAVTFEECEKTISGTSIASLPDDKIIFYNSSCKTYNTVDKSGKIIRSGTLAINSEGYYSLFAGKRLYALGGEKIYEINPSNMELVPGFGDNGVFNIPQSNAGQFSASDLTLRDDGTLLIAGTYETEGSSDSAAVVAVTPTGTLDKSFGENGIFIFNLN